MIPESPTKHPYETSEPAFASMHPINLVASETPRCKHTTISVPGNPITTKRDQRRGVYKAKQS